MSINVNAITLDQEGLVSIEDVNLLEAVSGAGSHLLSPMSVNQGDCVNTGNCDNAKNWGACTGGGVNGSCVSPSPQ